MRLVKSLLTDSKKNFFVNVAATNRLLRLNEDEKSKDLLQIQQEIMTKL